MKCPRMLNVLVLLSSFLLFSGITVTAQEKKLSAKQLPAAVASAFQKAYPTARIKGASSELENGKTLYEVESVDGKINRDIVYAADGTCVEIEETIPVKDVPSEVMTSLKKELPKGKIQKAEKLTKGETIQYEFVVVSGKQKHEVVIDPAGNGVKNSVLKSNEDNREKEEEEKD